MAVAPVRLPRVVDAVRQQPKVARPLDRLDNPSLLLAIRTRAPRRIDLADRIEEPSEDVESFVVDLLGLQLCRELFAIRSRRELFAIRSSYADGPYSCQRGENLTPVCFECRFSPPWRSHAVRGL